MFFRRKDKNEPEDSSTGEMNRHFSDVAKKYRRLRADDAEPVDVICNKLAGLEHIEAVDIGCGAGSYDLVLYKQFGDKLNLTCLDAGEQALARLGEYLQKNEITNFNVRKSTAETMPFNDNSLDCVFAFSAVRHFHLPRFLQESARVIKSGGYLFLYTRIREPGEADIRERYSPEFTLGAVKQALSSNNMLCLESLVFFNHNGMSVLEEMKESSYSRRITTYMLCTPEELEKDLEGFSIDIKSQFDDPQQVQWFDENVLFVIKIGDKPSLEYLKIANTFRPGMGS
jgi:ubiquinone/menaquinone biosynthesis C-methylase UbiE